MQLSILLTDAHTSLIILTAVPNGLQLSGFSFVPR